VPDEPVCVELSPSEGYCTYTVSQKSFRVNDEQKFEGKTWWEMRPYMLQVPPQTWARIKAYIVKVCKERGGCGEIGTWESTVDRVDTIIQR
jgi:hypothetical protein